MNGTVWPTLVLAGAFALANASAGPVTAATPLSIAISGLAYSTPRASVHVGDIVEWINRDSVDHTVTEKTSAIWNVSIAPGTSARVVMKKPGTYVYYCRLHPNMTASLVVK